MNTELTSPAAPTTGTGAAKSAEPAAAAAALAPAAGPVVKAGPPKVFGIDQRYVAPIFITLILLIGHLTTGILESPIKTLTAIGTAMIVEIVLQYLHTRKFPFLASAYITGISVGILVRSPALWPYVVCSAIAITSKYAIRVKGKHLWNPSNFAIAMMLFLASFTVASLSIQWSNSVYALMVIWIMGGIIIARLKRLHITLTYVVSFLVYSLLRTAFTGHRFWAEVAPITGPMYQLFIFFMITDPPTTVKGKKAQMLVAFLVATVECGLRLRGGYFGIHAPYYALFIVGPVANLIEMAIDAKKKRTALTAPAPA
jgi:Na+-translocating ferredoxin:NAD+ oxidoreductase RnfD subunit